jgi:hypothetical protein
MHPEERLLGFDAREMWLSFESEWSPERRDSFLLRGDLEKPLSTDTTVWPSAFGLDESLEKPPPWEAFDLWIDLGRMAASLDAGWGSRRKAHWVISLTLCHGVFRQGDMTMGYPTLDPLTMPDSSQNWTLLGYDVSDGSALSGLSNCGYAADELPELRERWGPHLNQHHLFSDVDQAIEFKRMSDNRVREHAPFFVYGLYLVEDNTQ